MLDLPYAVVDVFAETPLSGNPLAVVLDADGLGEERMAAIAVEFNLSETTFVVTPGMPGADWRLRSFTPGGAEVGGAGHNSLGAWWWLVRSGRAAAPAAHQELGGQVMRVGIGDGDSPLITLAQGKPEFRPFDDAASGAALSAALHPAAPPVPSASLVIGSVGSPHLLVPLAGPAEVDALRPDPVALRALLAEADAEGCYAYSTATGRDGIDAYARFFNPTVGIAEDPATGTAAGPLAAHLAGAVSDERTVHILQGVWLGRPSVLRVGVTPAGTQLSGRCALAATGRLHL